MKPSIFSGRNIAARRQSRLNCTRTQIGPGRRTPCSFVGFVSNLSALLWIAFHLYHHSTTQPPEVRCQKAQFAARDSILLEQSWMSPNTNSIGTRARQRRMSSSTASLSNSRQPFSPTQACSPSRTWSTAELRSAGFNRIGQRRQGPFRRLSMVRIRATGCESPPHLCPPSNAHRNQSI